MAVNITETNRRKRCLIFSGFSYRIDSILKNGDISWRCTNNIARCKARIRTDESGKTFVNAVTEHNHPSDLKKLEAQQLRVQVKRSGDTDIMARPSKIIRQELCNVSDSDLESKGIHSYF